MRKDSFGPNRAITLGDRHDWQLRQEFASKQERKKNIHVDDRPPMTRVYTASRYLNERHSLIWASVVSCDSKMYRLQAVEDSVDNLTSRGLLSAVATLAALTDVRGIIYYCDDPDLPNPLGRQAPPTEFTEGEQLLWDILVQLTAEREVFRWYGDPFIAPESLVLAQRLVEETVAGYSAKQEEFENRFAE